MALIQCPECGKMVSDMAPNCPNCGRPISNQQPPPNYQQPPSYQAAPHNLGNNSPDYGNAIVECFTKKFVDFSGRGRRSEFFPFLLCNSLVWLLVRFVINIPIFSIITFIVLLIPLLAAEVRRMHDIGKSGWWILVPILPFIFAFQDSDRGPNQYGPSPKYPN